MTHTHIARLSEHDLYEMASTCGALLHCYASSSLPATYEVHSLLQVLVLHHYQVTQPGRTIGGQSHLL